MPYEVRFAASAAREFRKLPPHVQQRLRPSIDALADEPRPPGARKLVGQTNLYRIRVGDYRVVYEVDDTPRIALVIRVRHRRDAYA